MTRLGEILNDYYPEHEAVNELAEKVIRDWVHEVIGNDYETNGHTEYMERYVNAKRAGMRRRLEQ